MSRTTIRHRKTPEQRKADAAQFEHLPPVLTTPLTDATVADFGGGAAVSSYVSGNGDGEVVLTPTAVAEFTGTTLPAATWSACRTIPASGGAIAATLGYQDRSVRHPQVRADT
jgi:hypothetical protein